MDIILGKEFHEDDQIIIVLHSMIAIKSSVKGFHACKDMWTPIINEKLVVFMVPDSEVDKYNDCVKKKTCCCRPLTLRKKGKFDKMIFYFLRADHYVTFEVIITYEPPNLGDGDKMQVPCNL